MRVKGSVKWKHTGIGGSRSTLKLKRSDAKSAKVVDVVQLGEFVGATEDFSPLTFDIEYSSNDLLNGEGQKGVLMSYFPCLQLQILLISAISITILSHKVCVLWTGESLLLAWKTNEENCQIEIQELNIELLLQNIDEAMEKEVYINDCRCHHHHLCGHMLR